MATKPKDIWTRTSTSSTQIVLFGMLLVAFISHARADDIPFDTNVPDASSNTGSTAAPTEAAPAPEAPASGNPAAANPPPATSGGAAQSAPPPAATEDLSNLDKEMPPPAPSPTPAAAATGLPTLRRVKAPAELSGLGNLAPFNDIAVISRRFLPKTNRFELTPNVGLVLNDVFFTDIVLGGRLGYYFTENYGIEAIGTAISTSPKGVTNELQNQRFVNTAALAVPTAYYGLDFKWAPIYGKLGWLNKSIVPFDFYFSGGGGITGTNQNTSPPTIHLGTGQIFALKKWMALRWDLSWYAYNSTSTVVGGSSGTFTNLHLTLGMSFFFPEAVYR